MKISSTYNELRVSATHAVIFEKLSQSLGALDLFFRKTARTRVSMLFRLATSLAAVGSLKEVWATLQSQPLSNPARGLGKAAR